MFSALTKGENVRIIRDHLIIDDNTAPNGQACIRCQPRLGPDPDSHDDDIGLNRSAIFKENSFNFICPNDGFGRGFG
jgi:hypothetical protein